MSFSPRDWRVILIDKLTYIVDKTPISAINPASIIATICEATSLEDDEQYFQMLEIIRNYSLNTTSGVDLVNRAAEYGLTKEPAKNASTKVTVGDSVVTKVQTIIYSGLAGPKAGDTLVYGDEKTNFNSNGVIIIGRSTNNVESVAYSSITEFTNYIRFNLSSALTNDHGTDELIIMSQGGNRVFPAGTKAKVEENDISPEVLFTLQNDITLLDGESEVTGVSVVTDEPGLKGNVPAGLISDFVALPFSTATVINPNRVVNGKDEETDPQLRDKIKLHIQGLSRGTRTAILSGIIGLEDPDSNTRVVSANPVKTNKLGQPSIVYIDDGTGFEPTFEDRGIEIVLNLATGGERILQLEHYPLVKAFKINTVDEIFNLSSSLTLVLTVNKVPETLQFSSTDWDNSLFVSAEEVARQINLKSSLIEARTTKSGKRIVITAQSLINEDLQITGGTLNDILKFPITESTTLFLYKNERTLLSKDGSTANIESGNAQTYTFQDGDSILIRVDGKSKYQLITFLLTDVSSEQVVEKFNTIIQGAVTTQTSNNTKVTITSNTKNSINSKLKVGRDSIVTGATSDTVFKDSTLLLDFLYVDQIKDLRVKFTSGALSGNAQKIQSYNPTTGEITLVSSIGGTPNTNDSFIIDGMANGNVGNPANSVNKLGFDIIELVGKNKDYTLNRTQGQIELENISQKDDRITAGTLYTRGQVTTSSIGSYTFPISSDLQIKIEGGSTQVIDFVGTYTPKALVDRINELLIGGRGFVSSLDKNKVALRTNNWDRNIGSIEVLGGTANSILNFPISKELSLGSHSPFLNSQNAEDDNGALEYTFSEDSNLILVLNGLLESPYNVIMNYAGVVTLGDGSSPYNTFRNSNFVTLFLTNNMFKDFFIKFTSGANVNLMRVISSYDTSIGEIVLSSAVPSAIAVSDTFIVLPRTAKNVTNFLMSTTITGISLKGIVEELFNKKVVISSQETGLSGSVNVTGGSGNVVSIFFESNGTVGGTVEVSNKVGVMIGQEIQIKDNDSSIVYGYITDITGSGPYVIEIKDARTGGSLLDLSSYTVDQQAYISPRNLLAFSTTLVKGTSAYNYYTGLLQKVQWTIDGKEDEDDIYPGIKATGTQVEVKPSSINRIRVVVNITTIKGVSLTSIQEDIKSAIDSYINNLGVSDDVIIAELVDRVMDIEGVYDIEVVEPSSNVAIGDQEIVRISNSQIIIG